MVNHRALQRTLFRMQLDPGFAERLQAGDRVTIASTGLAEGELAWLRAADPRGVSADRGGSRRAQFLRNVALEFSSSLALLPSQLLEEFPCSDEFHSAVRADGSLPLALARYLEARSVRAPREVRALLALESAMVSARRITRETVRPTGDAVGLAPWAHLVRLPSGTFALATRLREAAASGTKPVAPGFAPGDSGNECVLIRAAADADFAGHRQLYVEPLPPPIAEFLAYVEQQPRSRSERASYARQVDADGDALEALVGELLSEGALWTMSAPTD